MFVDRVRLGLATPFAITRRGAHICGLDDNGVEWTGVRWRVGVCVGGDGEAATAYIASTETRLRAEGQLGYRYSVATRSLSTSYNREVSHAIDAVGSLSHTGRAASSVGCERRATGGDLEVTAGRRDISGCSDTRR